jgi:hypothetical protein
MVCSASLHREESWAVTGRTNSAICEPTIYKMWEPRRLTTLWTSRACYRDSFTCCFLQTKIKLPQKTLLKISASNVVEILSVVWQINQYQSMTAFLGHEPTSEYYASFKKCMTHWDVRIWTQLPVATQNWKDQHSRQIFQNATLPEKKENSLLTHAYKNRRIATAITQVRCLSMTTISISSRPSFMVLHNKRGLSYNTYTHISKTS